MNSPFSLFFPTAPSGPLSGLAQAGSDGSGDPALFAGQLAAALEEAVAAGGLPSDDGEGLTTGGQGSEALSDVLASVLASVGPAQGAALAAIGTEGTPAEVDAPAVPDAGGLLAGVGGHAHGLRNLLGRAVVVSPQEVATPVDVAASPAADEPLASPAGLPSAASAVEDAAVAKVATNVTLDAAGEAATGVDADAPAGLEAAVPAAGDAQADGAADMPASSDVPQPRTASPSGTDVSGQARTAAAAGAQADAAAVRPAAPGSELTDVSAPRSETAATAVDTPRPTRRAATSAERAATVDPATATGDESAPTSATRNDAEPALRVARRVIDVLNTRLSGRVDNVVIDLPDADGLRVRVHTSGGQLALSLLAGELSDGELQQLVQQLRDTLSGRGFDMSSFTDERGERGDAADDDQPHQQPHTAPHTPPQQRIGKAPVRTGLQL